MQKKFYESPEMEVISFVTKEKLATDGLLEGDPNNDNISGPLDSWKQQ